MAGMEPLVSATVIDRLIEHLRARDVVTDGQEGPAAVLWTDPKAEWRLLIELLQARVEELVMLGDYKPEARTGPAIWIRCLVERALTEPALPEDRAPIVYLPGVARQDLRAGEECRAALKPLVELMYRGRMWLQPNGSDWGVTTFLDWKKDRGKEPQGLRPKKGFPWFWGCPGDGSLGERTDFLGEGKFDGNHSNDLPYGNAARRAARMRAEKDAGRV